MVKILGFSGSPKKGATDYCVEKALEAAAQVPGVETEFIPLRKCKIRPCTGCDRCRRESIMCPTQDDMQELYPKILSADGYIIASPVYVMTVTGQLQSFISRWRCIHKGAHPAALRNKVGGAIAIGGTRNGGQELTLSAIIHTYLARGIVVVGAEVGNYSGGMVWSLDKGAEGAAADEFGMRGVLGVGRRVAEVARLLKLGGMSAAAVSGD